MSTALVLTYHAVEPGPAPLCIEPSLFASHLDCIVASGARVLTVAGLAEELRAGALDRPVVAITFDDAVASAASTAAPLLAERGLPASFFCVAGRLGEDNTWPTQPPRTPLFRLADAEELAELAAQGFELGSHGYDHVPLSTDDGPLLHREIVESRKVLADRTGAPITSFALPYGAQPTPAAQTLLAATYGAVCTTSLGTAPGGSDPLALRRVDAHYVRSPRLLCAVVGGFGGFGGCYIRLRSVASRVRRAGRLDHLVQPVESKRASGRS